MRTMSPHAKPHLKLHPSRRRSASHHPPPLLSAPRPPASAASRSASLLRRATLAAGGRRRLRRRQLRRAKAKRVIYLFQSGGPAQQDLFDYKPLLNEKNGQQLPARVRGGQRLTGMSAQQASIPLAGSHLQVRPARPDRRLAQRAAAAHWRDRRRLCFVKSMFTEAINHDPAITFFQTGSQIAGRPRWAPGCPTAWAR